MVLVLDDRTLRAMAVSPLLPVTGETSVFLMTVQALSCATRSLD
jgi:hypothetical protein